MGSLGDVYISGFNIWRHLGVGNFVKFAEGFFTGDFGIKSDVFFDFWWVKTPALEAALADGKWKWYKTGLQIYHMEHGSRTCHPTKTIHFFVQKGWV